MVLKEIEEQGIIRCRRRFREDFLNKKVLLVGSIWSGMVLGTILNPTINLWVRLYAAGCGLFVALLCSWLYWIDIPRQVRKILQEHEQSITNKLS